MNTHIRLANLAALALLVLAMIITPVPAARATTPAPAAQLPAVPQASSHHSATQVSAGGSSSCAIMADGRARCWGANGAYQLGAGTFLDSRMAVLVGASVPITSVTAISVGLHHSCALRSDRTARCWGSNMYGEAGYHVLGLLVYPTPVGGTTPLSNIVSISAGFDHTCAALLDGTARCWGRNTQGQLGDGTTTDTSTPVVVGGGTPLTGVVSVSVGAMSSCALLSGGTVRCWGDNAVGQLGDGTTTDRLTPVTVGATVPLTQAQEVDAGGMSSCVRRSDGTVRCWGLNTSGQLGDGTTTNRSLPVTVLANGSTPLTSVAAISTGGAHACARLTDGTARCWGSNGSGQLGDGTTTGRTRAAVVGGGTPLAGVVDIGAGESHTCAVLTGGGVRCWGTNANGRLGNGSYTNSVTPATVLFDGLSVVGARTTERHSGTEIVRLTVLLSDPSPVTVTVQYATQDGTAHAGQDYTAASGTLTFSPGQMLKLVDVTTFGDTLYEAGETFTLLLSSPSNAVLAIPSALGTIGNDDAPPALSPSATTIAEGSSGSTTLPFTVTLSAISGVTTTVQYATSNGTATAGSDYTATNGTLTFAPGVTVQVVQVPVLGDNLFEQDETLRLTLSNASEATLSTSIVTATILNDEPDPMLTIADAAVVEGASGSTTMLFTVTLNTASATPISVTYATANGTASAGSDYTAKSGALTFAPGTTEQTIAITIFGDEESEPSEMFSLVLSNPSGAGLAAAQATGTIVGDESTPTFLPFIVR